MMQTDNRLLDDLARMANGALNTLTGLREEIENRVRERVERLLADMDLVQREEFEAVRAMAQKAREEQEDLAARVAALEEATGGGKRAGRPRKPAEAKPKRSTATRRRTTKRSSGQPAPDQA
jgi:BMFP domain-containing protein YqiC